MLMNFRKIKKIIREWLVIFLSFLTIISQIESENLKDSFKGVICDKYIYHLDHFTLSEINELLKEMKFAL